MLDKTVGYNSLELRSRQTGSIIGYIIEFLLINFMIWLNVQSGSYKVPKIRFRVRVRLFMIRKIEKIFLGNKKL